jgi:hypothetical protein
MTAAREVERRNARARQVNMEVKDWNIIPAAIDEAA